MTNMRKMVGDGSGGMLGRPRRGTAMAGLFQDHLGLDAVVAFADGALSLAAFQRAAAHIAHCPNCAAEVDEQAAVRRQLRAASEPEIPARVLTNLLSIPLALPVGAPAGRPAPSRRFGRK